jgi:hypothetical protein
MPDSEQKTVGKTINTWVQTVFIVIAALWGIYAFVFKEIFVPRSAPINISMNLELKEVGSASSDDRAKEYPLSAIEVKFSATNPSTREVYLLPSAWIARGVNIAAAAENEPFLEKADQPIPEDPDNFAAKDATLQSKTTVAVGKLFTDASLKPKETITRTIIFYVKAHSYDSIEVKVFMPSAAKRGVVQQSWIVDKDKNLVSTACFVQKGQPCKAMSAEEADRAYWDPKLELQSAESSSQLSLRH